MLSRAKIYRRIYFYFYKPALCVFVCVCFKARAYNCQIRPAVLDSSSRVKWTNTTHHPPHLVGEEVSAMKIKHLKLGIT